MDKVQDIYLRTGTLIGLTTCIILHLDHLSYWQVVQHSLFQIAMSQGPWISVQHTTVKITFLLYIFQRTCYKLFYVAHTHASHVTKTLFTACHNFIN